MMIPWLTPSMIASWARGIFTFKSTCARVAPNESAASTVFASTPRIPFSTSRATTGNEYSTPAIIPGTIETGIR
jgi:hypothetical protein